MDMSKVWEIFERYGFFSAMRRKLREKTLKNYDYKTMNDLSSKKLIDHLYEEVEELKSAIENRNPENILEECADVANSCGFIFSKIKSSEKDEK